MQFAMKYDLNDLNDSNAPIDQLALKTYLAPASAESLSA